MFIKLWLQLQVNCLHELGQMVIGPLLVLQLIDLQLIDLEFTGMARHILWRQRRPALFGRAMTTVDWWDNISAFLYLSCIFVSVRHSFVEPGIFGCTITMTNWWDNSFVFVFVRHYLWIRRYLDVRWRWSICETSLVILAVVPISSLPRSEKVVARDFSLLPLEKDQGERGDAVLE